MTRVLYVHSRRNTFTDIDRTALAEHFEVEDYYQYRLRVRPVELVRKLRRADGGTESVTRSSSSYRGRRGRSTLGAPCSA